MSLLFGKKKCHQVGKDFVQLTAKYHSYLWPISDNYFKFFICVLVNYILGDFKCEELLTSQLADEEGEVWQALNNLFKAKDQEVTDLGFVPGTLCCLPLNGHHHQQERTSCYTKIAGPILRVSDLVDLRGEGQKCVFLLIFSMLLMLSWDCNLKIPALNCPKFSKGTSSSWREYSCIHVVDLCAQLICMAIRTLVTPVAVDKEETYSMYLSLFFVDKLEYQRLSCL